MTFPSTPHPCPVTRWPDTNQVCPDCGVLASDAHECDPELVKKNMKGR